MYIADVMNCTANGIQKSSASPDIVFVIRQQGNSGNRYPIMDNFRLIIEQDGGNICFTILLLQQAKTRNS